MYINRTIRSICNFLIQEINYFNIVEKLEKKQLKLLPISLKRRHLNIYYYFFKQNFLYLKMDFIIIRGWITFKLLTVN